MTIKAEKTLETLQREYHLIAAKLGDRDFKINLLQQEITELKSSLFKINEEAQALVDAQKNTEGVPHGSSQAV